LKKRKEGALPSIINRLFKGNKFREAFYAFLYPGQKFVLPSGTSELITNYFEGNATVFSAVNKIVSKVTDIPLIPYRGETEVQDNPLENLFVNTESNYSFREYRAHWHLFRLLLGESIVYVPRLQNGNNAGMPMMLDIMPPQNIEIESGGPGNIVRYYKVDSSTKVEIEPKDVYHSRLFLNADFSEGKQFRGISPLKVASNLIAAMNSGNDLVNKSYETGMPPGILYNKNLESSEIEEQKRKLEQAWRKKQKDVPVFGGGELGWIPLGFSNLRDLQIVETDKRGLRILCNIWGIHESLFSGDASTLDNLKIARRLLYEDRIMPDVKAECDFYNELFKSTGIEYRPDYSGVQALQDDKLVTAQLYGIAIDKKVVTRNEMRTALGLQEIENELMGEEGLIESIMFAPEVPGIDTRDEEDEEGNE
jgi:HK97 family phage portal protein